jgi:iron complex outermembrane receptor protein
MKYKKLSLLIASFFITGYAYSEEVEIKSTDLNVPKKSAVETKGSTKIKLDDVVVKERLPISVKYQLPNTVETNKAEHIMETINILDTEDALKYMPSLFVRKRNYGDTQPVLATRTWGLGSSARSLVYADDVLLTALIGNDNNYGSPRWGMVAPEEIERIDVLYGPYSAQYSGNSMGAVVNITTRMPEKFEGSVTQTIANQSFSQYGTNKDLLTSKTSAIFGDKINDFSFWASVDHQDGHSQPLGWVTNASQPSGTSGGYSAVSKLGQAANVYIAGGLQHSEMDNLKAKIAYDITPSLKATYTFGYWSNDAQQRAQTFLTSSGQPTYGGLAVGSYFNNIDQQHTMHNVTLKTDTQETFDWELVASFYNYDHDRKQSPLKTSTTNLDFVVSSGNLGTNQVMDGTGWSSYDFKGIWRPDGKPGSHEVSFGIHRNDEELSNLTYNNASAWDVDARGTLSTAAKGKASTDAVWVQDAWKFMPNLKATVGGRFESWSAYDGYNLSSAVTANQIKRSSEDFSPKASLSWDASNDWRITGSLGQATRYPTVIELYQLTTTNSINANPNPNLKPEDVFSGELAFEKMIPDGKARISFFNENVHNALISQTNTVGSNAVSYVNNVDKVRNRGVEIAYQQDHFVASPFEIQASVTYVDSRILKDSAWAPALTNPTPLVTDVTDKHGPYVPMWRATLLATWRSSENLSTSLGLRYSGKQYSTLDNIDHGTNVMGGFDSFFVADIKTQYKFDRHWTGSVGVDNLFNEKYTLYHPFPQRTAVATLKYNF